MAKSSLAITQNTKNQAERVTRNAATSPAATALARFGYAARGVVYFIIGLLAAKAATGGGGATTDRKGALDAIYQEPFGKFLLGAVVVGLVGYVLWSFTRAFFDVEHKGSDAKGLANRFVYALIGISYGSLAVAALHLLTGSGGTGKSSDANTQDWTARLLDQSFGPVLVVLGGLIVLGLAGFQFYQAYSMKFEKHLKLSQMSVGMRNWTERLGRFGLAARGIVFGVIGVFLLVAAEKHNAHEAKGLGGALKELASQPYGQVLLGITAVGLIAYGLYSFIEARYRSIATA